MSVPPVITLPVPGTGLPGGVPDPVRFDPGIPLYQFVIAIVLLVLLIKYVPGGIYLGWIILAGVVLSTPDAVQLVSDLLQYIEGGFK